MRQANGAAQQFHEALRSFPAAGGGVHTHVMKAANLAVIAGIATAEAEAAIIQAMTRPPSPTSEVSAAIAKAYREARSGAGQTIQRTVKPKPLPMTAAAFIRKGDGATEADWWERSPVRIDWGESGPRDAVEVLKALWQPSENLFTGDQYGRAVAPVHDLIRRFQHGGAVPPHIVPNPMSGKEHPTKDGKPSFRCDDAVVVFRFAVAEFDGMSKADQLSFWWGFTSAPIAALIDSGGKSIHAWLKVDCPNREVWERDVEQGLFSRVLIPLGCDAACRNESRLSRLPGHFRTEKGAWQKLLYLDPKGGTR